MFKWPAEIKLITVDVQMDLNCMDLSLPGALCVALPSLWFLSGHTLPRALWQQQSHALFLCWFTLDDALALWLGKDGFFLGLANNVNF